MPAASNSDPSDALPKIPLRWRVRPSITRRPLPGDWAREPDRGTIARAPNADNPRIPPGALPICWYQSRPRSRRKAYYEYRAALHAAMDRAVLDACGWERHFHRLRLLLDYEIDEAAWDRR